MDTLTAERPSLHAQTDLKRPIDPDSNEAPGGGRRRRRAALCLALVAALVLAALVVPSRLRGDSDGRGSDAATASPVRAPGTPSTTAAPAAAADTELQQTVTELEAFVSSQRHLEFLQPVRPTLLDDEAFRARLGADDIGDAERESIKRMEAIMKALGLLTPEVDLVDESTRLTEQGVLGLYSSETKELLVRGASMTPYAKSVLVHELTHALDDQHFGLERPDMASDLEEGAAFRALVEGDAARVEHAYVAAMSPADRAAVDAAEKAVGDGIDVDPQVAYYFDAFPYVDGPTFVEALADRGGEDAVDAAFARPPRTTAEILVPDRYMLGISGVRLSAPSTRGTPFESGVFGALGLYMLLQTAVSPEEAAVAAVSWEGDIYLAWHDGDRTCVTTRFLLDTPWTAAFTAKLFTRWAARQLDAHVEAPGTVVVTSCR